MQFQSEYGGRPVTLSILIEYDNCGVIQANGISVARFTNSGKIVAIKNTGKNLEEVHRMGFLTNEGRVVTE